MSFKSWWEERKRLQEEREARRLGDDWDDDVWTGPEEESEPEAAALAGAEAELPPEPEEPDPETERPVEPDPAGEESPPTPDDVSWWKQRLLGPRTEASEPEPVAEAEAEPEPEPEPEPVAEAEPEPEPEPGPVAEAEQKPEPEPEPVAEAEPEPELEPEPEPVAERELEPEPEPEAAPLLPEASFVDEDVPVDEAGETLVAVDDDGDLYGEDDEWEEPFVEPVPDEDAPPPVTDFPGPRRARLEGERRRRRRDELRRGLVAAGLAAVVGSAGVVAILSRDEAPQPPPGIAAKGAEPRDTITTTLVFGTKEQQAGAAPTWLALLSYDTSAERGSVVFIPPHTATGVPGRGLLPVGDALESGGIPLLLLATETLLGTPVDRYVELSDADAAVLFDRTGPLTVEVPEEVRIAAGPGQARLIFAAGPQRLSPDLLVDLLYVKGLDSDDVELGARHLAFWSSLFEAFAFDSDGLARAVRKSGAAVGESDASPQELARLFEQLAEAEPGDRRLALLPVRQVGVGGSELYQADAREIEAFLTETVGAQAVAGREVRVQILNGNGAPGVGQHVAERLGDEGFRVILSGNARRLNYRETLVITYDRSSRGLDLAERTRQLIGVGEVQVAAQSQGIVDLTIVVGKDFLKTL
jgi:hypothetical protein